MMDSFFKFNQKYWWIFALSTSLLAIGLMICLGFNQSVWFDEGYSILLAKSSFSDLLSLAAVDAHPPFYYLLLKLWGESFGFSVIALRSLSAILMGATIFIIALILRRQFGNKIMLLSLPILLLAPFLLRYGYEIRMYSLAALIGASATLTLLKAQSSNKNYWWILYACLVALGMYSLYMTIVIWLAHLIWLLTKEVKKQKVKMSFKAIWHRKWFLSYLAAIILFLPQTAVFVSQTLNSALPGIGKSVTLSQIVDIFTTFTFYQPESIIGGWQSLSLMVLLFAIIYSACQLIKKIPRSTKSSLTLFALLSFFPLAFFTIISLPPLSPVYIIRYLAPNAIYIYALLAIIVSAALIKKQPFAKPTYFGTVIILLFGVFNLAQTGNFNIERWQDPQNNQLAQSLNCNPQTQIIADDPYTYIDNVFYLQDCNLQFFSPQNVAKVGGYAPLHDSEQRIADPEQVNQPTLIHLRWDNAEPSFQPSQNYQLKQSLQFDKQIVDIYQLNAE